MKYYDMNDEYYSIVVVSDNKILYRVKKLFDSVKQAKVFLKETAIESKMVRIQKVKLVVL